MSFEVKKDSKDGATHFTFVGHIDEEAKFPRFEGINGTVRINLEGVKAINSVGIRSWLNWFQSFSDCQFIFTHCPKSVVMQMNMVEGFLPAQSTVESFQVPYYCESCDEEVDVLFTFGKEVVIDGQNVKLNFDSSKLCSDGNPAELDANESKYFKFLLKMGMSNAA